MNRGDVNVVGMLHALRIEYRARGDELWACCPAHSEKTPSWSIKLAPGSRKHGSHKCWGCGFEGGPLGLVMQVHGFSSYDFCRQWLVERGLIAGASVPAAIRMQVRISTFGKLLPPAGVRFGPVERWPTPARRYAQQRGLRNEQVERWGLGCGVDGRLACRIYLPTHAADGELCNWTARTYAGRVPKYLDPEHAAGANKSAVFGELYWPPREQRVHEQLVLCEGELNALACERAGARFVGGLGGSELGRGQVLRLAGFGSVLVASDPDGAGSKVALALNAVLARHARGRRIAFPVGMDACDVEQRQGTHALAQLLGARV